MSEIFTFEHNDYYHTLRCFRPSKRNTHLGTLGQATAPPNTFLGVSTLISLALPQEFGPLWFMHEITLSGSQHLSLEKTAQQCPDTRGWVRQSVPTWSYHDFSDWMVQVERT